MATSAKAIVQRGNKFVEETVTLPELAQHEILLRVNYASLNPTDVLAFDLNAFGDGAILGCDLAGTIEKLGPDASRFKVGDKVASFIWGGEKKNIGALSEYCIVDERTAFAVPKNIGLDAASTISLAAMTAFLALFSKDCLALPQHKSTSKPVLILGASSSVGAFTAQIAAINGIETIGTASQKNFQAAKDNGVKEVYDYHDADAISKIQQSYPGIDYVFDTIGNPSSNASAGKILGSQKSQLCTVRPGKTHTENLPDNIKVSDVFVFTVFPKEHSYRGKAFWPVNMPNHELAAEFFAQLSDYLASGKIKPRPVKSMGKLSVDTAKEAVDLMRGGGVSNQKLCFTVAGN